jgi:hypothetical protein
MYKYEVFEYGDKNIERGNYVIAYVPGADGKRFNTLAQVVKINGSTIRVEYMVNNKPYQATIAKRYFYPFTIANEIIVRKESYYPTCEMADKYKILIDAGVENWEGYDNAMRHIDG